MDVDLGRPEPAEMGEAPAGGPACRVRPLDTGQIDRVARVALSDKAVALLTELTDLHGPLMFHQSGGCCDGSSPMCYPDGEFRIGAVDVKLADLDAGLPQRIPFWMSESQFAYWSHTHLTIDVVPGRGGGFSVESPTGQRFLIRSRLFTDEESERLTEITHGG